MLADLLVANLFSVFLVFCRVGSAFMLLPGFGEGFVFPRARLALAVLVSVALAPVLGTTLPPPPASPALLALLVGQEVIVGLAIGALTRILASALQVAGSVIATQTGLATAAAFDPTQGEQAAIVSQFLSIAGVVAIFATDLHHLMLAGLLHSYGVVAPLAMPAAGDMAQLAVGFVGDAFTVAAEIAAPFLVGSIVFFLGLGILARLMPQVPIFFVAVPLQLALGLWLFMIAFGGALLWYLDYFASHADVLAAG